MLYQVEVEIAVDADSPEDARNRIANMLGDADFRTGIIYDDEGVEVTHDE